MPQHFMDQMCRSAFKKGCDGSKAGGSVQPCKARHLWGAIRTQSSRHGVWFALRFLCTAHIDPSHESLLSSVPRRMSH
jgi:hypothetical protein